METLQSQQLDSCKMDTETDNAEDFEDDPVFRVLDMLNFTVVPKTDNVSPEHVTKQLKSLEAEQQHNELLIQNVMLSRDVCVAKEENLELAKQLKQLNSEFETLEEKYDNAVKKLTQLEDFTKDLKCEFGTLLRNLSSYLRKNKAGENPSLDGRANSEITEFLKLLEELGSKIPDIHQSGWDIAKGFFGLLNNSMGNNLSVSIVPQETGSSAKTNRANSDKQTNSTPLIDDSDDEIQILEENVKTVVNGDNQSSFNVGIAQSKCCFCEVLCSSQKVLVEHASFLHNGCCLCKRLFGTKRQLADHIKQYHCSPGFISLQPSRQPNSTVIPNNSCSSTFPITTLRIIPTSSLNVTSGSAPQIVHISNNSPIFATVASTENSNPTLTTPAFIATNTNNVSLSNGMYRCPCGEHFATPDLLQQHIIAKHQPLNQL